MKKRPLRHWVIIGLLTVGIGTSVGREFWSIYTYVDSSSVIHAARTYAKTALATTRQLPAAVTLRELVNAGCLSAKDVNWATSSRIVEFRLYDADHGQYGVIIELKNTIAGGGSQSWILPSAT